MKKIIFLIFIIFLLSGCYDYQELSDMSIIDGIGIDYKDNKYIVHLEMIKSSKENTSSDITTDVVSGSDKVLANAFQKAINNCSKKVYMRHVELLMLSEKACKHGIDEIVDYIIRDVSISTNFYTVVTKNPKKVLKTNIKNDSVSKIIVDTLTFNIDAKSLDNIDILASNIINRNIDIALPYISIENKNIEADKIAYFKNSKMVNTIDSKIYNFLILDSVNIDFESDNNVLNIYNKKIDYDVKNDLIIINVSGLGRIKEVNQNYDLKDGKFYKKIEDKINKTIEDDIITFINKTLDDGSDLVGLKDKYYKKYKSKKDSLNFKVNVDINFNKNGAIYEVLHD